MKKNEILEGNKMISRFASESKEPYRNEGDFVSYIGCNGEEGYFDYEDMQYHTSWNWLMPVVEKIENIKDSENNYAFSFDIGRDFCVIFHNDLTQNTITAKSEHNNKIKSVWLAVVEFIKWYNSQRSS